MDGSDGSPPQSLCMIRAAELFPKPPMEKEDVQLTVPFTELAGESVKYLGRTDDGVLALSNYRIFLLKNSINSETSVPLGLIESAQSRDLFHLVINCKDASTVKCSFETAEQCSEWQRRITLSVGVPESLESLFAFPFCTWTWDGMSSGENSDFSERLQRSGRYDEDFRREVERLQFDLNGSWRISHANEDFKLCPSYPQKLLVPCCISDETLHNVANFRGSRRLPAVVWRHKKSGAVIARCSQPEVGWLGWRNSKDEQLLKALAEACAFDRGEQGRRQNLCRSGDSTPSSPEGSHEEVILDEVRKILIVDARSYTSAVTNRARGGGCECIEYYPCAEIEFMNLSNIHVIRKSFQALRLLCASPPDVPNWLGLLEKSMWLQHLSGLLAASVTICHAIEKKGRPVLVHCSDGWDRTPQLVATAQLCLDPFYRTVEGFRILVEREWLSFGHKFADRCGHGPGSDELNERCPVFLQWLDLVHQIHKQFPCCFEFSMGYLIKLAQHSLSCLFGTFFCNTLKERIENSVFERTFSVWPFLSGPMYRNPLYVANKEKVLWPAHNVRDLSLWTEVYLGSLGNQNGVDFPPSNSDNVQGLASPMAKTRSYGDLITAGINQNGISRRSSDPNMTVEPSLMIVNNSQTNSISDVLSDREDSPDIIATLIHDTTERLQHLTNELNQHDDDDNFKTTTTSTTLTTTTSTQQVETARRKSNASDLCTEKQQQLLLNEHKMFDDITKEYNLTVNGLSGDSNASATDTNGIEIANENGTNGTKEMHEDVSEIRDTVDGSKNTLDMNPDLMQSVDLGVSDTTTNYNLLTPSGDTTDLNDIHNAWHGSVNTSTDTLVPMSEMQHSPNNSLMQSIDTNAAINCKDSTTQLSPFRTTNGGEMGTVEEPVDRIVQREEKRPVANATILPKVHSKPNLSMLSSCSLNSNSTNPMEESILILPEHPKLEISISGKCETVINSSSSTSHRRRRTLSSNSRKEFTTNGKNTNGRFSTPGVRSLPLTPPGMPERPQIAISCPDGLSHALSEQNIRLQQIVHEHKVREDALLRELHGMRMALLKKICPSCNSAPVVNDEQVDVIMNQENNLLSLCYCYSSRNQRRYCEDGAMYCGSRSLSPCSVLDNGENLSVCSWEAVEDRSGASSCASSIQPTSSVLWVPDHAVSRCTSCQTEFWLGRRKHHCRSCGQIFCADCSEFWAPLPDEKLFSDVRLCGPCYHSVTTRMQLQNRSVSNFSSNNQYNNQSSSSSISTSNCPLEVNLNTSSATSPSPLNNNLNINVNVTSSAAMEACKHAVNPPRNDRGLLKATTASN
ncbi:myotubularin-related protein 3 isoform X3 [Eupeodes corollae]|uniref:myotubularin-related protein 3 isoform X3 n=1 Tax=Eupeodes corollae TaxID=290404 RepID=UPI0024930EA6|nr:myotubularin-related protein 3 isoform X3 [Eupeodes corollae]